ncbi:PREDICTED: beta-hexosaminidase subunit beta-like [Polistes dominula]|uniref:Beta-hexosaminidase n=1 Tax=Polistes dominula TaxID=743375 RepID=A0ABM1JDY8_POLDO|nr:PREDICTED: beta-hexosaminidase subunit beta-like [Polistes dominula]
MWFSSMINTLLFIKLLATLPTPSIQLHSFAGSWVLPTKGEIWPKPNQRVLQDEYFLLRPSAFEFRPNRHNCDIINKTIDRYMAIIITEARIARTSVTKQSTARDHEFYKGELNNLDIELKNPCEHNGEHWPHLFMNESYTLEINTRPQRAILSADSVWGIIRGLETFSQIVVPSGDGPVLKVNCQTIVDSPKLRHRGLLLDTSRHFLPVDDICTTLDAMSYNKLNVLHWHIVDDNSFPYLSSMYPDLAAKGAYHFSMIYTPNDIQYIVEYARLRGIRVIPEFDTPGHVASWGLAYPEFLTQCYGSDGNPNGKLGPINPIKLEVYEFMRKLFSEIVRVFPDQYVHLGGDEVPFDCWASNPEIKTYMQANNMSKNFALLEGDYISRILEITKRLEAKSIVWQEVFDNGVNLPNSTVVHVWTGRWQNELERAVKAGHPVLLSACWYLDHLSNGGDWKKYYACDPLGFPAPPEVNVRDFMLGGEACMWGEFVDRTNIHTRIWPRACAAAERLWTEQADSVNDAARRLEEHACRMNVRGVPTQPPNGPGYCIFDN